MKKFQYLLATSLLLGLAACGSDNDPIGEGNRRGPGAGTDGKVYTVALSLGGDYVHEYDSPLTRADNPNTYVGINVTRKKSGSTGSEQQYAHALYKYSTAEPPTMNITLEVGYAYSFEATMLVDRDDSYRSNGDQYEKPFVKMIDGTRYSTFASSKLNKFFYAPTDDFYFNGLASGNACVHHKECPSTQNEVYYPRVDRYYGTVVDFTPKTYPNQQDVTIDLKYKCFGLAIEATSIPEGTYLTWEGVSLNNIPEKKLIFSYKADKSDAPKFTQTGDKWENVFSLNNLKSETNSEQIKIKFTWHKGMDADVETETFDATVDVTAKKKKTLKVNITGNAQTSNTGNIKIIKDDNNIADDENPENVNHTEK